MRGFFVCACTWVLLLGLGVVKGILGLGIGELRDCNIRRVEWGEGDALRSLALVCIIHIGEEKGNEDGHILDFVYVYLAVYVYPAVTITFLWYLLVDGGTYTGDISPLPFFPQTPNPSCSILVPLHAMRNPRAGVTAP